MKTFAQKAKPNQQVAWVIGALDSRPHFGQVQAKLTVSSPGDILEQEADRMADRAMSTPGPKLQRACSCGGGCPQCRAEQLQRTTASVPAPLRAGDSERLAAPPIVQEALAGPGQALDPATRAFMEPRFGQDFSRVRVHANAGAAQSAAAVSARAYTVGANVVFGARQFAPATQAGKWLLAHELTHVLQQGGRSTVLQRTPDDKPQAATDLQLPWKHGDHSLFELRSSGIRFLVATGNDQEPAIRKAIPAIGKQLSADNARITDPSARVGICIIASTTTRFAFWEGKPVVALSPADLNVETAAHEMGHAIFRALKGRAEAGGKDAAKAGNFRLMVADIFARLSETQDYTEGNETHPCGLWIADPSQWVPGGAHEHPWDDPDEFFASAKAAFQINRKGLESAIAHMKKIDRRVAVPAKELLALLDAFFKKGTLPAKIVPQARAATAQQELERETGVSKIEDTVKSSPPLNWLLYPASRPQKQKAGPSITSPY